MTEPPTLPKAAAVVTAFGSVLRQNGLPATPDQTVAFLKGIVLLGPQSIHDIHRAALVTFGPGPEDRASFDALFRAHFYGDAPAAGRADAEESGADDGDGLEPGNGEAADAGEFASVAERLQQRNFTDMANDPQLDRLAARFMRSAPRRRAFRCRPAVRGDAMHMRRSIRQLLGNDGDIPNPAVTRRSEKPRNIALLIDVSSSMKAMTQDYLHLGHLILRHVPNAAAFTFATRLTDITPALRRRHQATALAAASAMVDDWDGGTRIGPCLSRFVSVPRHAGFVRGAAVLVISDGLEQGDISEFVGAVRRLSRLAWRLTWATPLAADPRFEPRTRAMQAILPALDDLVDGSSADRLARMILDWAKPPPGIHDVRSARFR